MTRELNIINRAVEEFDYELDLDITIQDTLDECENIIFENVDYDRLEECELYTSGGNQSFNFCDGKGYNKDVTGDIFDWANYTADKCVYFRLSDGEYVNWFDLPNEDAERHEYGYIYDRVLDTEGKVVALYDRF